MSVKLIVTARDESEARIIIDELHSVGIRSRRENEPEPCQSDEPIPRKQAMAWGALTVCLVEIVLVALYGASCGLCKMVQVIEAAK